MTYNELQNRVYQNAAMGITALREVIPAVHDKKMKEVLVRQYEGYKNQTELTASQMKAENQMPKALPLYERLMAKASTAMNIRRNSSTENIAKMLIKGTNTGIIELTQTLNRNSDSNAQAVDSAKEYLKREQEYIESLKHFL